MAKNTYYFQHDYHANKDPKCAALINDFGMAGYGLYWCLIEILHEQGGKLKKFPKLYDGLAYQLKETKEALLKQIEAMVNDYELLKQDENYIWSDRVLQNLEVQKNKYLSKAESGRIGGKKSGLARSKTKQNEAPLEANEQKEIKGKEIKGNKIIDIGGRFTPPTLEEIKTYCTERNNNVDPQRFYDFYSSKGWMVGRNKMKDWQAAVRTWEKGDNQTQGKRKTNVTFI